jgi:diguanylate cyclase (GGDEF)-like protein
LLEELGGEVEAQLLAYAEHTTDLVGVVDEQSQVLYLNPAARKRLGIGEGVPLTSGDIFPPQVFSRYYDEIRPTLLRAGTWTGELQMLTASGEVVPVSCTVVAQIGTGGEVTGLVTHGREIKADVVATDEFGRDVLTGLPESSVFDDRVRVALRAADWNGRIVAVMAIGVDGIVDVNETHGRAAGDDLLRVLAHRVALAIRDADTVARIAGDQFGVLFDGVDNIDDAISLAHRIREAVARVVVDTSRGELAADASFGIAIAHADDVPQELLTRATAALQQARRTGTNQIALYDFADGERLSALADEFALAVSHGLIRPHVQPIIELRTGTLRGYQGLARWEHPTRGLLDADDFVHLVADTAMAPVVDLAVLRRTAAAAARVARRGMTVRAYGHLSRRLLGNVDIEHFLVEIANDLVLANSSLCCEIAYPIVKRGVPSTRSALRALHDLGVRTVLSEVDGTCDANDLVENGFDEIRLARSFLNEAALDRGRRRVLEGTVALAHALSLPVTAVGIDTSRLRAEAIVAGCDYGEGTLLGGVIPAGDVQ